jgi:hypothetical protein
MVTSKLFTFLTNIRIDENDKNFRKLNIVNKYHDIMVNVDLTCKSGLINSDLHCRDEVI